MKSVMLSIRPEWCEKISRVVKTVEVRKTKPKIETPFKCYIYCTGAKTKQETYWMGPRYHYCDDHSHNAFDRIGNGKVIGEFVCDEMYTYFNVTTDNWESLLGDCHENDKEQLTRKALLSESQVHKYANGKNLYGWHISNLKIYDCPKELSKFEVEDREQNKNCIWRHRVYQNPDYNSTGGLIYGGVYCRKKSDWCCNCNKKPIQRPPQSWCYVKEMKEEK